MSLYITARFREYLLQTGEAILHYWQWLVMVGGIFFLVIDFEWIGSSIASIVMQEGFSNAGLIALLGCHITALSLVIIQKRSIQGGRLYVYLKTLPVIERTDWLANILILLAANSLFWLYLALPLIFFLPETVSYWHSVLLVLIILNAVLILLVSQLYWLRGRKFVALMLIGMDGFIVLINSSNAILTANICLFLLIGLLLILLSIPVTRKESCFRWKWRLYSCQFLREAAYVPQVVLVQHRCLLEKNLFTTSLRLIFSILINVFIWSIIVYGGQVQLTLNFLAVAGGGCALVMSGLFKILNQSHEQAKYYLCTQPTHNWLMPLRDFYYVGFWLSLVYIPLIVLPFMRDYIGLFDVMGSLLSSLLLLAVLQRASNAFSKHSVVIAVTVTITWISVQIIT